MKYNATIIDHFNNPRNAGALASANAIGEATNDVCLDVLKLYLRVNGDVVAEATFQAEGCVPSIACGSFLTEYVRGRSVAELRSVDAAALEAALGGLPTTKKHAAHLGADALREALEKLS
jgi:NifU-like protein involved in Fe-S cluster formation